MALKRKLLLPILIFIVITVYLYTHLSVNGNNAKKILLQDDYYHESKTSGCGEKGSRIYKGITPPSNGFKILHTRTLRLIKELQYITTSQLVKEKRKQLTETTNVFRMLNELSQFLEVNVENMHQPDASDSNERSSLQRLGDAFQKTLHSLQHPSDCENARFLTVDINKVCGFGCQMHHLIHCFTVAYATNRTIQLKTDKWSYSIKGFSSVFQPLSSCSLMENENVHKTVKWGDTGYEKARNVFCPIVESFGSLPAYAHPAVPTTISRQLMQLHGAPHVWFVGQFLAYIMRPKKGILTQTLNDVISDMHGSTSSFRPIVGIHVRRTDKIQSEASFHNLAEYMFYVDKYFDKLEMEQTMLAHTQLDRKPNSQPSPIQRRVFLATDDPGLFNESRLAYPNYKFHGNGERATSSGLMSRYSHNALLAIVTDVIGLSSTDYIVCTFSSQICRLSYELMQTYSHRLGDASLRVQSLDDVYYYGGQQAWPQRAILSDTKNAIEAGSLVTYHGNHWNGFAKVSPFSPNRFQQFGSRLSPAFKFESRLLSVPFGPSVNFSF